MEVITRKPKIVEQVSPTNMKEAKIKEVIAFHRGMIMDCVEMYCGGSQEWVPIRSMILKNLGDSGLEKKIFQVLRES